MDTSGPVNPDLVYSLRRVTERAACAAFNWIGRGDSDDGGRAALDAMRGAVAEVDIDAVVVIGEATAGEAPQPQRGEHIGRPGAAFKADIAVDPVEGTSYLVRGLTNALAVLAVAPRGAMMNPGPAFYMENTRNLGVFVGTTLLWGASAFFHDAEVDFIDRQGTVIPS